MNYTICTYEEQDAKAISNVAVNAFMQYKDKYSDWDIFISKIADMPKLASSSKIIVAKIDSNIVGAVAYVAPDMPKSDFFNSDWAVIRMLVVDPEYRGYGIGKSLTNECIKIAKEGGVKTIALHTTHVMERALAMYLKMGFKYVKDAPDIFGVAYKVYTMDAV